MKSILRQLVFFLFLLLFYIPSRAAEIPVLLRLSFSEQADSNGCNFVEQLTGIIYKEIVSGNIKLWDSPAKEIQITGITLQELEKNSNTLFINQEIVYIYELWQSSHKSLTSVTLGFNFSNKNAQGEDVAYGFVEYSSVRDLFLRTRINTNANGDFGSSYAGYINNKTYQYNIIQFNGKVIKDIRESNKIKAEFIGNKRFNAATFVFNDPDKLVTYLVEINNTLKDERTLKSNNLILSIESFLSENQEVFYNIGGDKILSHIQKNQLKVTRIEFNELWKKINDSIFTEIRSMTIFVNDSALSSMNVKEINRLNILIEKTALVEFIRQKKFGIIITQINSQKIPRKDAFLYYKAITEHDWRQLSSFVKNY